LDTKFEIEALPVVTRELNIEPPISVSAGLHATFGFREFGQQPVAGGTMAVSLQVAPVRRQNAA
jgi:predicted GNAT superfamily acetyltransferase